MPRGKTGTVRGLSARRAQECMEKAVEYVERVQQGHFTRAGVRDYLVQSEGLPSDKAYGIASAMTLDVSGISERVGPGLYRLRDGAARLVRHRGWRLNVGKLPLAEAEVLIDALAEYRADHELTPGLERLYKRGRATLRNLRRGE